MSRFLGKGLPHRPLTDLPGFLVAIEGGDFSGRRTQIVRLANWLEARGFAVMVDEPTERGVVTAVVEEGEDNGVGQFTLGLLHATDLADSLETRIIPAMLAGYCVVTDRYVYSRMAKDMVHGLDLEWLDQLYGFALRPNLAICLEVQPEFLLRRALQKRGRLNLDFSLPAHNGTPNFDRVTAFIQHQERLIEAFRVLATRYGIATIDGSRSADTVEEFIEGELQRIPALYSA